MPSLRAVLFDLDGVLTPTAELHMHAWRDLFSPWCVAHGAAPYADADYFDHIDGKPRYAGVATSSRPAARTCRGATPPTRRARTRCARWATRRTRW